MRSARSARARRRAVFRVLVAAASLVVLLTCGVGWSLIRDLTGGISTTPVIGGRLGKPPGTDQNILLVGVDSRTDAKGRPLSRKILSELRSGAEDGVLNSDTIIILHVPADGSRAVGISIPRDSYVDVPGEGKNKINAAYPMVKLETAAKLRAEGVDSDELEKESAIAGQAALVKTVEELTGITIDHYAEVNLLGFYNLTNAVGGVEVCLKDSVNEAFSGARFPAGRQMVSGGAALAFVRQRHELPHGDFDRIRRQQVFLAAVAHKILSAGTLTNPAKLQGLVNAAKESVVLDTGWDVLAFARQASDLAGGRISFTTIPVAGADTNPHGDVVLVDPGEVRAFVAEKTGSPAAPSTGPTPSDEPSPTAVSPASLVVDVRNGTGRNGLAAEVARELRDRGYRQGRVRTAEATTRSSVHYPPGEVEAGDQVARVLGGIDAELDYEVPAGQVRVYLGEDFSLSDITGGGGPASSSSPYHIHGDAESSTPASSAEPPSPPITADGVPCVD